MATLAVAGAIALLATACGNPPGPRGWAAAQPIETGSVTLVPYKKHIYALPKGSGAVTWQFPPEERDTFRVSDAAQIELKALVTELGLPAGEQGSLEDRIDDLSLSGPTVKTLKDAISAVPESDARDALNSRVDGIVAVEKRALSGIRALYGDLGVSDDGETAFVPSYGGWLFALDVATGATRWIVDLDPMVGGVTVDGDVVYVGTKSDELYALDTGSGAIIASKKFDGEVWAAPALAPDDDDVLVATLGGSLYRLSSDFEERWKYEGTDGAIAQTPVVDGEIVYVGAFDNRLYAIDVTSGNELWSIEADNWFWGQPIVIEDTLYAASLDGKVYAVDARTGEARWQRPFDTGSQVRSGLASGADALIVGARDGYVHRLELDDGTPRGSPLQVGNRLEADLTSDDEGNVYAVPRNPRLWVIDTAGTILSAENFTLPE